MIPGTTAAVVLLFLALGEARGAEAKVSSRLDSIDVDAVLRNERILRRYVDCMLDRGQCTAEGREFKSRIPDALRTDCAKCSEVQQRQAQSVLDFLIKNQPRSWELLANKYDPDASFRKRHNMTV